MWLSRGVYLLSADNKNDVCNKIRSHGIDYVVSQMRALKEIFKLDFFVISDDTFITLLNTPSLAEGTKAVLYYRCNGIRTYKPQCI